MIVLWHRAACQQCTDLYPEEPIDLLIEQFIEENPDVLDTNIGTSA